MIITHQYRIKPNSDQVAMMDNWLELLRRHWNYALGQRLDWLRRTRCQIDRCSMISEPIGEIPTLVSYLSQQAALKETKKLFPDYKDIYAEVQQINLQRLDQAWWRWLTLDKNGKRAGRPRFKKKGELRSFCFSRVNHPKAACFLSGSTIRIPRIGEIPGIVHRPIPNGFTLKTATLVKKADGWYICVSLSDASVPAPMPIDTIKTAVGIDVGLEKFLATSDGEIVPIQQTYRKSQNHLGRQQRKLAHQQKGSANYKKQANRVARIHQRIQRKRKDFHYKTAHQLVRQYDLIAVEDLKIKGLARTHWGKSILDAAWGSFITILEAVAVIRGVHVVKVNPNNTSQDCSGCGVKVKKDLSVRWHSCPHCHTELDRDINAAINILKRAIENFKTVGLIVSACGGLEVAQPLKQEAKKKLTGFQLTLF
jgi:transposase, IS605 OrfB family, central region